jgi:ATP-binding cassette subfamily B (MDR/TAP) protein 1
MNLQVPHFIVNLSNFIASYTVGIYMAWQLSITALAFLPLLVLPGILYGRILAEAVKKMREEYMKAGVVAEMAISSIRTIYSFVGEERTLELFSKALETTVKLGLKQGLAKGLTVGSNGVVFAIWGFMAWYGNNLILNHGLNGGNVIATGLASITGGL